MSKTESKNKIHLGGERTYSPNRRLRIRNGCDLRASLVQKETTAQDSWEAFVNEAGTLMHVVHGPTRTLVRVPAHGGEVFKVGEYTYRALQSRKDALRQLAEAL